MKLSDEELEKYESLRAVTDVITDRFLDTIDSDRKEIKRLRDALEEITQHPHEEIAFNIATAALEQKE